LLPLHSGLSPFDQQKVFEMVPGIIKIIASTNIAETSLTIEDVKIVIDTGRVKQMRHDTQKRTSFLEETWASRANIKQRKGRAGRVSGGTCYFLFPRSIFTQTMNEQPIPEIKRAPLTSLCLQIKTFGLGDCRDFLGRVLEPPNSTNIDDALEELYEIGALMDHVDQKEELTSLGKILTQLPVDVKVGKMLIYGALFGCLDPISTIAAILETKSPFVAPIGRQKEMNAARKAFFLGNSDLLTDANAYQQWEFLQKRSNKKEQDFCWKFFLDRRALTEISKLKKQFRSLLSSMGFVDKNEEKLNENTIPLVSAIICAGLTPNMLHVEKKKKNRVVLQDQKQEVLIHPSSVNDGIIEYPSPWVSYHYKLFTSNVYVPISNMVTTSAMIIFSGKCDVFVDRGIIKLNDWIQLSLSPRSATIFKELREHVMELLLEVIENPLLLQKPEKMEHFDQTTRAIKDILNTEYNLIDPTLALRKIQNK
jgi:HrpA-like RNA helicase